MNPDGSNIRPLACGLDWSYGPEWDPSGRFLFCVSQWGVGDLDVWLTDVAAGETDLLVADPEDQHSVTLSPDSGGGSSNARRSTSGGSMSLLRPAPSSTCQS